MEDDEKCLNDILRDTDFNDPFFDLDFIEIPKSNYDPLTPIQKINKFIKENVHTFKKHIFKK